MFWRSRRSALWTTVHGEQTYIWTTCTQINYSSVKNWPTYIWTIIQEITGIHTVHNRTSLKNKHIFLWPVMWFALNLREEKNNQGLVLFLLCCVTNYGYTWAIGHVAGAGANWSILSPCSQHTNFFSVPSHWLECLDVCRCLHCPFPWELLGLATPPV
jgi:hypothetical protein